jgi:hypothetical protein
MAEVAKDILGRFPIDQVLYIFVSGFFLVIAFPFDFSSLDLSHGLPSIVLLLNYMSGNFAPFVGIKYLGAEFPTGLVKMLLASLPVGVCFFYLYGAFQSFNNIVMKHAKRVFRRNVSDVFRIVFRKHVSIVLHIEKQVTHRDFYEWAKQKELGIWAMRLAILGLFNATEVFLVVILVSSAFSVSAWSWLLPAFLIVSFCYSILKAYEWRFESLMKGFSKIFEEERQEEKTKNAVAFE